MFMRFCFFFGLGRPWEDYCLYIDVQYLGSTIDHVKKGLFSIGNRQRLVMSGMNSPSIVVDIDGVLNSQPQ